MSPSRLDLLVERNENPGAVVSYVERNKIVHHVLSRHTSSVHHLCLSCEM